jgi:putative glutamine amidotransferase
MSLLIRSTFKEEFEIKNRKVKMIALIIVLFIGTAAFGGDSPLIGITSVFQETESDTVGKVYTNMSYVNAVLEAGGTPVVLPPVRSEKAIQNYVESLDGMVLVGGMDIPPHVYGEKAHATVDSLTAKRFWFESRLISAWLESDKSILGICLGCQFTNVQSGGTLIQDIPSEIGEEIVHRQQGGATHEVRLAKGSRLHKILGDENLVVNSYHHQAVDDVGDNLTIVAHAPDGVVEALEFTSDRFGIFVQWHPERMPFEHRSKIFSAFVSACQE